MNLAVPNDRHVLAAAIKCQADVIVTNNLNDFPENELDKYEIEAQSPDIFLSHVFDLNPMAFYGAVQKRRQRLLNQNHTAEELLNIFYSQGLPIIANKLMGNIALF